MECPENIGARTRHLAVRVIGETVRWLELAGLVLLLILAAPFLIIAVLVSWWFGDE